MVRKPKAKIPKRRIKELRKRVKGLKARGIGSPAKRRLQIARENVRKYIEKNRISGELKSLYAAAEVECRNYKFGANN